MLGIEYFGTPPGRSFIHRKVRVRCTGFTERIRIKRYGATGLGLHWPMAVRNPRAQLSPGALYGLLNDEFKKVRPAECDGCQMPLPFRVDPPDDVSANWRIGTPTDCPHDCRVLIAEIVARMWPLFDLRDEATKDSPKVRT